MIAFLLLFSFVFADDSKFLPQISKVETILDKPFKFPDELPDKGWFITGFTRGSSKAMQSCIDKLEVDLPNQAISMAILEGAPFFLKGSIKSSILSKLSESRKQRYLVLHDGREAFQKLYQFEEKSEHDAYIMVFKKKSPTQYEVVFTDHQNCEDEARYKTLIQSLARYSK